MDRFLKGFDEFTGGKYPYLRIKKVELYEYERRACIYFMIPENKYENFDNNVIKDLNKYMQKVAKGYQSEFYFERIVLTEDIVLEHIKSLLDSAYPFISASISDKCIKASLGNEINVELTLEEDVYNVAIKSELSKKLILSVEDTFAQTCFLTYKVVEKGAISIKERKEDRIVSKRKVPLITWKYLYGIRSTYQPEPSFIDTLSKPQDNACVCGNVVDVKKNEYEKRPDSQFKYYRYLYRIRINDHTGELVVSYKTNDNECPLDKVTPGFGLAFRGRLVYSERTDSLVMYAKTIYTCTLDNEKIKDDLKPLPPPSELRIPSIPYKGNDFYVAQSFDDILNGVERKSSFSGVFFAYRNANKKSFSPWSITMLSFEDGVCKEVYSTFVRVYNTEEIDSEFKAKVVKAPRLAEIVPDILCFTKNKLFICQNAIEVIKEIQALAKPQRYTFEPEFLEGNKIGSTKGAKGEPDLMKSLKDHSVVVEGEDSYPLAIAMARLYLMTKKN